MRRAAIARPLHVVVWVVALAALAWFASTPTGAEFDLRFARWIGDLRMEVPGGGVDSLLMGVTEVFRPLFVGPAALLGAILLWRRLRAMALLVPLAFGTSIAMTYVMKWLLDRERPGAALQLSELPALHDAAFPSAHVAGVTGTGMAVLQVALPMVSRAVAQLLRWAVVALIAVVGLSRVWVGAHWLTDIAGGLAAGVVGLIIALLILRAGPIRRMAGAGFR